MASKRLTLMTAGLLVLSAASAHAITSDDNSKAFEVSLRETVPLVDPSQLAGAKEFTDGFASRVGGSWQVYLWNPLSDSPQAIIGSGVDLGSAASDAAARDLVSRFIANNADLLRLNPQDLQVERVVRGMGKVAVHFTQNFHGVPVAGSRVRAILTEEGRLYVLGSIFYRDIHVNPVPGVSSGQAAGIARNDLPFNAATDKVLTEPELLVLPVPGEEGGVVYHLVWRVTVGTADPYGAWVTHVDAHDGRIVWRYNDVHSLYSGTAQGDVDQSGYCDGQQTSTYRLMNVNVSGLATAVTDTAGRFSVAGTGGDRAITAAFTGPQLAVSDVQFGNSSFNGTIQENVPFTINWTDATPSRRSERDCFYWVNETYAFVKKIDPTWTIPAHTASVNVNSTCNANWTTWHMNFFREGGGCANTGTIGDVMAHEFGHGIQHSLLGSQGNEGLGEGNGDITGTFMIDDSVIGRGFYLNTCTSGIRDCENTLQYPGDVVGQEIHNAGRVICGFNWDTRQALEASMGAENGEIYGAQLWHYSRKLYVPDFQTEQVLAYFTVDDNDGNLNNGTPNYDQICEGATNHGFSCPEILVGVIINHTPLRSTTNHVSPYTVSADIVSTEAPLDITRLFYRIDGGSFNQVDMVLGRSASGAAAYTADIPAQANDCSVEYYIYGHDTNGNERTNPPTAPATLHQFYVATVIDELEAASGWTVGDVGDNATTGVWELVDPVATIAQPGDDHTPAPGVLCFVTGQQIQGQGDGFNDVDGGTTTLLSPVFDLSQANVMAKLTYWRWYSNNLGGAPNADNWVVDVSNDGGNTWTSVENVNPPNGNQNTWVPIQIDLVALFGTPNQVKLRFKASDLATPSLVEAAVDDVIILTRSSSTAVEEPAASGQPVVFSVGPNLPNPFNPSTVITYTLPEKAEVTVTVFDVGGRVVRSLVRGVEQPGAHEITWNGLDDTGRSLPSGSYYYRVEANGHEATRKMVLLK